MKRRLLILAALLVGFSVSVFAVDLASYGYEVAGTHQENELTVIDAKDANGLAFSVGSAAALTDQNAGVLKVILAQFDGWQYLKIARLRINFSANNHADILVIPASFSYKGVDLSTFMPSGMQFQYDGFMGYDFRLYKDNLFLRLKGQVYDEAGFADRLIEAINNPVLYLQTNSPEYLLQRIDDLVTKVDNLSQQVAAGEKNLTESIAALQDATTALKQDADKESDSVDKQLSALVQQNQLMQQQVDQMRNALLTIGNRNFFGQIAAVSKDGVAKILELKKDNPSMTKDQVRAEIQKSGIKMSDKEISLVLGVYFNEF